MATTINKITTIPPAGKRGVQVRDEFVATQEKFQDALSNIFSIEINTVINQTNSATSEVASNLDTVTTKTAQAAQSASDAADAVVTTNDYKNAAHTSAANADISESNALQTYIDFKNIYVGSFDNDHVPTKNYSGGDLVDGNLYFNTSDGYMKIHKGSAWGNAYANMDGAMMTSSNLSDVADASASRTNLGLKIGTDVPHIQGSTSTDFNVKDLAASNITTGTLTETSARKYKENIEPLTGCLGVITQLEPVTYNRKGNPTIEIGLIADDVVSIRPEYVKMVDGEVEGIFYQRIVADLIGAVKELQDEVNKLKQGV